MIDKLTIVVDRNPTEGKFLAVALEKEGIEGKGASVQEAIEDLEINIYRQFGKEKR